MRLMELVVVRLQGTVYVGASEERTNLKKVLLGDEVEMLEQ